MRVHELARELGLASHDVLRRLKTLGHEINTASSMVLEDAESALRASLTDSDHGTVTTGGMPRNTANAGVAVLRQTLSNLGRALEHDPNTSRVTPAEVKALVGILSELGFMLANWIDELAVEDRQHAFTSSRSLPDAAGLRAAAHNLGLTAHRRR